MQRRPTTQDISWFLDLYKNGQLDLDPPYQRRSVWSPKDRRFFLDTIFRGYPTPAIYLHKEMDEKGGVKHAVVDGKQRLETIIKFAGGELAIDPNFGNKDLDGKKWGELHDAHKRKFWDYVLPVEFISVDDPGMVNEVFDRLNRNSRKLLPQELRHAKYDGWLVNAVENELDDPFWTNLKVVTEAKSKRMRDAQFISELFMLVLHGQIEGFDQEQLDKLYADYDEPVDAVPDFDESEFKNGAFRIKATIQKMIEIDPAVLKHAKTANNLYSLWGVLALCGSEVPENPDLANKYVAFMSLVEQVKEEIAGGANLPDNPEVIAASVYRRSATGASTDLTQRKERHAILLHQLKA